MHWPTLSALLVLAGLLLSSTGEAQQAQHASRHRRPARTQATAAQHPVLATVDRVAQTLRSTRYSHATRIVPSEGRYEWDCSVLVAWVLRRATPRAERELEHERHVDRPLARDYLQHLQTVSRRNGSAWTRVRALKNARPGDIIAWTFPRWIRTNVTGHVAILIRAPYAHPRLRNVYIVRVADSASVAHDNDTRLRGGHSGFGYGDILVQVDPETGSPVAYRPNTRPGTGFLRTSIALGRPRH